MKPNKIDAIIVLCKEHHSNIGITIRGKEKNISSLSCLTLEDGSTPSFNWKDVEAKHTSMVSDWESQAYARNRKAEYNALNQLEMQFDDKEDGTTTWEDAIKAIKKKYPKG